MTVSDKKEGITMNQALFSYIAACPTAFQAAAHTAALLEAEGYRPLRETEEWML